MNIILLLFFVGCNTEIMLHLYNYKLDLPGTCSDSRVKQFKINDNLVISSANKDKQFTEAVIMGSYDPFLVAFSSFYKIPYFVIDQELTQKSPSVFELKLLFRQSFLPFILDIAKKRSADKVFLISIDTEASSNLNLVLNLFVVSSITLSDSGNVLDLEDFKKFKSKLMPDSLILLNFLGASDEYNLLRTISGLGVLNNQNFLHIQIMRDYNVWTDYFKVVKSVQFLYLTKAATGTSVCDDIYSYLEDLDARSNTTHYIIDVDHSVRKKEGALIQVFEQSSIFELKNLAAYYFDNHISSPAVTKLITLIKVNEPSIELDMRQFVGMEEIYQSITEFDFDTTSPTSFKAIYNPNGVFGVTGISDLFAQALLKEPEFVYELTDMSTIDLNPLKYKELVTGTNLIIVEPIVTPVNTTFSITDIFLYDHLVLVILEPKSIDSTSFLLTVFSWNLWLILLIFTGFSLIIFIVNEKIYSREAKLKNIIYSYFSFITLSKSNETSSTLSKRIMIIGCTVTSLVLITYYTSAIYSSLLVSNVSKPTFETVMDIFNLKNVKPCFLNNGIIHQRYLQNPKSTTGRVIEQTLATNPNAKVNTFEEVYAHLNQDENSVFLASTLEARFLTSKHCNVVQATDHVDHFPLNFAYLAISSHKPVFSFRDLSTIFDANINRGSCQSSGLNEIDLTFYPLNIRKMSFVFGSCLGIIFLSFMVAFMELARKKWKLANQRKTDKKIKYEYLEKYTGIFETIDNSIITLSIKETGLEETINLSREDYNKWIQYNILRGHEFVVQYLGNRLDDSLPNFRILFENIPKI